MAAGKISAWKRSGQRRRALERRFVYDLQAGSSPLFTSFQENRHGSGEVYRALSSSSLCRFRIPVHDTVQYGRQSKAKVEKRRDDHAEL